MVDFDVTKGGIGRRLEIIAGQEQSSARGELGVCDGWTFHHSSLGDDQMAHAWDTLHQHAAEYPALLKPIIAILEEQERRISAIEAAKG